MHSPWISSYSTGRSFLHPSDPKDWSSPRFTPWTFPLSLPTSSSLKDWMTPKVRSLAHTSIPDSKLLSPTYNLTSLFGCLMGILNSIPPILCCPTCNQLVSHIGLPSKYIQNPMLLTTVTNMVQATVISHLDYRTSLLSCLPASALNLAIHYLSSN